MGFVQDKTIDTRLMEYDEQHNSALHSNYVTEQKSSIFGEYRAIDNAKLSVAPAVDKVSIVSVAEEAKKSAIKTVALFPLVMLVCYLGLMYYFKSKGGYKVILLKGKDNDGFTPA